MSQFLSKKLEVVQPSPTIAIARLAGELRRSGKDVIGLSQGEPDFDTPRHICDAAKAAIDAGLTRYTDVDGTLELKQAIVRKFERDNGLKYETSQITVGPGGKQVIFNAIFASVDAGDEVIIPAPYWVSYPPMAELAGATPVIVETDEKEDYQVTAEMLKKYINKNTKAIVLNYPSNPVGSVFYRENLEQIGKIAKKRP